MWSDFIWQILGAFVALLVGAIGTWGGIYLKQIEAKLKRKMLLDEINRYVTWMQETESFESMSQSEKIETVLAKVVEFAEENEINVTEKELDIMVENAIQSFSRLETIGLRLMKRNLENKKGDKDGITNK